MTEQLELNLGELPEPANCSICQTEPKYLSVPGCPRCEGEPGENGLCWNHQNEERRARERMEPMLSNEEWRQENALIDLMAADIMTAAAQGRPMPWAEGDDMTGSERLAFRYRIQAAMRRCGTVIITAPPPPPPKRNGKVKTAR